MNNILGNMPPVVKNLLILNVIMFIVKELGEAQGIPMTGLLGGYVFGSPFFEPYQLVSHFFMHGDLFHIFFNMFALVVFGSVLEQVWGAKRFFIFYVLTALGAVIINQLFNFIELQSLLSTVSMDDWEIMKIHGKEIINNNSEIIGNKLYVYFRYDSEYQIFLSEDLFKSYNCIATPMVGASGAIFGLLAAFAYLFPNTQLMLLFPPIPVKAKWLVLVLLCLEIYRVINVHPDDNIAHFAHLGGAVVGFIIVLIWQRDKKKFY